VRAHWAKGSFGLYWFPNTLPKQNYLSIDEKRYFVRYDINDQPVIIITMVKGGAGRGGAGRGTKPGRGQSKARKSADMAGIPKRSGELGACKDIQDKMFVLSVNNKAKDGDVFRKTLEAIVTYVGSHFGENVAKELQTRQRTVLQPPILDPSIETKWQAKVAAHQAIMQAKVDSYARLLTNIENAVRASPGDLNLAEKQIEVEEKKSKAEQELLEDPTVESVMTLDEKYSHSNAHRTHREDNHKLSEN